MNFAQARYNMVEQQIRPWDVLDFRLLEVLMEIPRENFVCEDQIGYAYADMHLPLPNGSYMLEPKIIARMVQALQLTTQDHVLEIASGAGYATAVLAKMAGRVTTVDIDAAQQQRSKTSLEKTGIGNVTFKTGDGLDDTLYGDARFDAVYIGGAVSQIPDFLKNRLSTHGRMVAVIGESPVMQAVQVIRENDNFTHNILFDTDIPRLVQGERSLKRGGFVF